MTSSNALIFGSIRAFVLEGIWETPLGYHSPFENLSDALFYADLAIQGFISIVAGLSALGIELGQVVVVDAVEALTAVSVMNLRLLGGQLETGNVFDHMKTAHLRNICVQIQDFNRYETIRVDLGYFLMKSVFKSVCFWYLFFRRSFRYITNFMQMFYYRSLLGPGALAFSTALGIFSQNKVRSIQFILCNISKESSTQNG